MGDLRLHINLFTQTSQIHKHTKSPVIPGIFCYYISKKLLIKIPIGYEQGFLLMEVDVRFVLFIGFLFK